MSLRPLRLTALSAGLLLLAAPQLRADEPDLPSPAEIQKQVDDARYASALHLLQRVLSLTGAPAAAYDRFDMFMLRAECLIQLRQQTPALDALAQAKKEAFAHHKPDRAADAIALAFLLQRSRNFVYSAPAAGSPKPLSVLDRPGRGALYRTLLADEFPVVAKRVALVNSVQTLPPLLDVARSVGNLRATEYAAIRDDKQTSPFVATVAAKAEQLLDSALINGSTRVASISHDAQNVITELAPTYTGTNAIHNDNRPLLGTSTHRQGVNRNDAAYLRDVQTTCAKVSAAANDLQQALDVDSDAMTAVKAKAEALAQQVQTILTDNYADPTPRPGQ